MTLVLVLSESDRYYTIETKLDIKRNKDSVY